jgi:hypothetical protein
MLESGIRDYRRAKIKAAERLGINDTAAWPPNNEIDEALLEHQRLFFDRTHANMLQIQRKAALQALAFFSAFSPRLVGPVLEGTAGARSPIQLHLHSDDAEAVTRFLHDRHIPAQLRFQSLRLNKEHTRDFPLWLFTMEELPYELTVLPYDVLRQAPLSPTDGQPMKRASRTQLDRLLHSSHALDDDSSGRDNTPSTDPTSPD